MISNQSVENITDVPIITDLVISNEEIEKNVDEVLASTGCGLMQFLLVLISTYLDICFAYQTLIMYYAANDPPWICSSKNSSDFCLHNFGNQFKATDEDFTKRCKMKREDWMFTTQNKYSIVTEYDLVCSREYLAALTNASLFIGWGVGGIFTGILADKYGRKITLSACFFCLGVFAISSCYITAIWQLAVIRALIGVSSGTCTTVLFIYVSEFSAPKRRALSLNLTQLGYSTSLVALTLLAVYIRKWRDLELYAAFPGLLGFVITLFIPESPRWLNETGQIEKAEQILRRVTRLNNSGEIKFRLKVVDVQQKSTQYSYIDLFRKCPVILFVLAQFFAWFASGLVYYGLALESSNLGGSIYTDFLLSNVADIVGNCTAIFLFDYFGRRKPILFSFGFCSIILAGIAAIPLSWTHATAARITLALAGKVFITICFNGFYIWSAELFPTVIRTQGMTIMQVGSRAGSAIAPFITSVFQSVYEPLPFIIMSAVSLLAALFGVILPETNKMPTREKFEDITNYNPEGDVLDTPINSDIEPLLRDPII